MAIGFRTICAIRETLPTLKNVLREERNETLKYFCPNSGWKSLAIKKKTNSGYKGIGI